MVKDPICGKDVDTLRARAVGIFGGATYYFCSPECKAKYVDPRKQAASPPPREIGERRQEKKPSAISLQPSASEQKKPEAAEERSDEPVRYARSRMRRVTGEVATPVVHIDLSPNKSASDRAVETGSSAAVDEPLAPARSGRAWAWIAIVMLILAGGIIFFTLKHR